LIFRKEPVKTIKPLNQGLLTRVFEQRGEFSLSVAVLSFFSFKDGGRFFSETEGWQLAGAELGKQGILDECMPKANGEVLIAGKCFAPEGREVHATNVRVRIGPVDKTLAVFGNRFWQRKAGILRIISEPEPFTEMPITYENAFGGPGFKQNPLGKGYAKMSDSEGKEFHPLPNIENSRNIIDSPKKKPDPAGFGPIDLSWPQRMDKAGTYSKKWQREFFPGPPADMDSSYYNMAPEDQWIKGFFRGSEAFEIENMHPEKPHIQEKLPEIKSRCFMNQMTPDGEQFREIQTVLDTVWLFPHSEWGIIVWRGVAPITTDDAEDVLHILTAYERLEDEPRTLEHYQEALVKRLDEENGQIYMLDERDLIPSGEQSVLATMMAGAGKDEGPLERNMRRKAEREKQKAEDKKQEVLEKIERLCKQHGLDPSRFIAPPPQPSPDMIDINPANFDPEAIMRLRKQAKVDTEALREKSLADATARKAEAEKKIRAMCDRRSLDYDQVMAKLKPRRPVFSAAAAVNRMKTAKAAVQKQVDSACAVLGIDYETAVAQAKEQSGKRAFPLIERAEEMRRFNPEDPELLDKFNQAEAKSKEIYRQTAHHGEPPESPAAGEARQLREAFIKKRDEGVSFDGADFAGADLSGLDLQNIDLSGVYLEGANLSGSDLTGANLSRAVLAWVDLSGAAMRDATMHETCLGAANLTGAVLTGANLSNANLGKAHLAEADLSGAVLEGADFTESKLAGAKLSKSVLKEVTFLENDLSGVSFAEADLSSCMFINAHLAETNFSGAQMTSALFVGVKADKALFTGADLTRACAANEASFAEADFRGATLNQAGMRGSNFSGANFEGARLEMADLSECSLKRACLHRALARQARFEKSDLEDADMTSINLFEGSLMKAKLVRTDLRGANLYSAECMRAVLEETDLRGANLKKTKISEMAEQ